MKDEALPFGVGGGLVAIKTLLSRDPCVHANTAIEMIDAILKEHPAAQPAPVQEPVAFKIYKPTLPQGAVPNVLGAKLPWVYDQDPSSGNVASMWVTPVKATPPAQPAPVPLTDAQINTIRFSISTKAVTQRDFELARAIEAAHGITKGQP
jgi:hypothetical protein